MHEIVFRHYITCLHNSINIPAMNANGNCHDHVLWLLCYTTVESDKVGSLKDPEAKAEIWVVA